jgi:biopolymer transport protein ExbB
VPFARVIELATASGGILFLMPLMLLMALTVSFERMWWLRRTLAHTRRAIAWLAPRTSLDGAAIQVEIERLQNGPAARLLGVALQVGADRETLQHYCEEAIMMEVPTIDRSIWILDTIVTLAPLLGLLGTIVGMFNAFQILGKPGSAPTEITAGIAEALIATAAGLLIAIVGIVFFNALQTLVRLQVHELETLKIMLINRFIADKGVEIRQIHLVGAGQE